MVYREVENGGVCGAGVSISSVDDPAALEFLCHMASKGHVLGDIDF